MFYIVLLIVLVVGYNIIEQWCVDMRKELVRGGWIEESEQEKIEKAHKMLY